MHDAAGAATDYRPLMKKSKLPASDYTQLVQNGTKIYCNSHLIFFKPSAHIIIKAAAKKSFGNAVERNKEKRQLREILHSFTYKRPYFFLIIALRNTDKTFEAKKKLLYTHLSPVLQ